MARPREHLARAPLREALIDLQFERRLALEAIHSFERTLAGDVTQATDIWETQFGFEGPTPDRPPQSHARHAAIGRRLEFKDGPYVLQCRVNGFTLSRLSPYGDWSELRSRAAGLWHGFAAHARVESVDRIAVRYINELKLPLPFGDFEEFLTSPPRVPNEMPQAITGFLTRQIIPDEAKNCMTIVTQALEEPPIEGPTGTTVTVILDIDVFRQAANEPAMSGRIWEALDVLRAQKNRAFFAYVTEKTVEMYE